MAGQPTTGQLLRRYRSAAGLTQEELADRAGYSSNYIGKLERDQRSLPTVAANHLAAVLGLTEPERQLLRAAQERGLGGEQIVLTPPAGPLAGRQTELAQIQRLLDGTGPPVLLLAGEPGIGKTRLLEEAAALAASGGWQIAQGGCLRRAQDAYAPLTGAVASALARLPAKAREEALARAGRADLLLPELSPPTATGPSMTIEPEQQRRLLVTSALELLRGVAGPAGTLLVLDDLHWAGPDAVGLLAALLAGPGSPPIRVIGAYRDSAVQAELADFIADLARAALIRVLELDPLTDAQAGELLTALAPETEPGQLRAAIVQRAGGVPFFLVSYAEQLRDDGPDGPGAPAGRQLAVPWTVAQVIKRRFTALPVPTWELLAAAAVVGRVVPHALLAEITGRDDEHLLTSIEGALAARLLIEDGPASYRFPHDLIRETLEQSLSAARRRLLHRRVGLALRGQPGAQAQALAFHFGQAGDNATAAGYLIVAGDQAQQRVAYAAAAEFYGAAIGRLKAAADAGAEVGALTPVTEKHGVALYRAGRYNAAITALEDALASYRATGDAEATDRVTGHLALAHYRAGSSHDAYGSLAFWSGTSPAANLAAATAVFTTPAPDPTSPEGTETGPFSPGALARWQGLNWLRYAQGSYADLVTAGRETARAGRAASNADMQAAGLRAEAVGLIYLGHLAEGTELMAGAMPSDPGPGQERVVEVAGLLSSAYLAMGAVTKCQQLSERMLAAAERAEDEVTAAMHTAMLAGASYVRGDWQSGRELIDRAQRRFTAGGSPMAVQAVPVLGLLLTWQGATDQALTYLNASAQAASSVRLTHVERAALTYLADFDLMDGRPRDALSRLRPIVSDHRPPATEDLIWSYAVHVLSTLATAHLDTGDLEPARAYAARAVDEARRLGSWTAGVRALEVHGLVLARDGQPALARDAYQEGLERASVMPFPYGQARLLHAAGQLDHQLGDKTAARAKFTRALAIFENLGANHDAEQLRRLLSGA